MDTIRKLKDKGIPVIFEKEGINTMELKSEFLLNILSAVAQEESHSISLNLQWALEEKNKKGISTGSVSYGYQKAYPHKWEIDNEEAERVRYAFSAAAQGKNYREIMEGLNRIEANRGSSYRWHCRSRVRYLLRNVSYEGDLLTGKQITCHGSETRQRKNRGEKDQYYIQDHHEPLVTRAMFNYVQLLLDQRLLDSKRTHFSAGEKKLLQDRSWVENIE